MGALLSSRRSAGTPRLQEKLMVQESVLFAP